MSTMGATTVAGPGRTAVMVPLRPAGTSIRCSMALSFRDRSEQIARRDLIPDADIGAEVPQTGAVEAGRIRATGDVEPSFRAEGSEWALGAVEDRAEQPGTQLGIQRLARRQDRLVNPESGGVLEGLYDHQVAVDPDDLTQESVHADPGHVEQAGVGQIGGGDHRPGDLDHPAEVAGHLPRSTAARSRRPGLLLGDCHDPSSMGVNVIW